MLLGARDTTRKLDFYVINSAGILLISFVFNKSFFYYSTDLRNIIGCT